MSITTTTMPAERLVIMSSRIRIWSGTVKLERDTDLVQINGQLPPKELVSDGRKQLIPAAPLLPLYNVRKQIERALKAEGFAGLVADGIAVTAKKADEFLLELSKFEQAFEHAREGLIANLHLHYDAQEQAFPEWATMLRSARLSRNEVRDRCKFGMAVFRMAPPDADSASPGSRLYADMMGQALPTLMEDIAADAGKLAERFKGRSCVKQAQVAPVRRLVEKLKGFAFLDPRVQPIAAGLTTVLDGLPLTGALNAAHTACCVTVLKQLMDPVGIIAHGLGVIENPVVAEEEVQVELPIAASDEAPAPLPPPTPRRRSLSVAM
ncbi:MAG: DUF3150 domain-containing protein [Sulfuricaulis sp.]